MNPTDWLKFLEEIASQADRIALRFFRKQNLQIETKPDLSPVTEADKTIEEGQVATTTHSTLSKATVAFML